MDVTSSKLTDVQFFYRPKKILNFQKTISDHTLSMLLHYTGELKVQLCCKQD